MNKKFSATSAPLISAALSITVHHDRAVRVLATPIYLGHLRR